MSSPAAPSRGEPAALTIAVVGAASAAAGRIADLLGAESAVPGSRVREVRALSDRRGAARGVSWRIVDATESDLTPLFEGVDAVVWVAQDTDLDAVLAHRPQERRAATIRTARAVLAGAAAAGVRHVVVVTSATVHGARAGNPVPLREDAPVDPVTDGGLVGDLILVEEEVWAAQARHPQVRLTVLRPAALVGPGVDTVITRHFEAPRLLAVRGSAPAWQFCHLDDLATAVLVVLDHGLGPVATVGCEGFLHQDEVERLSGMRRIELSEAAAMLIAHQLHRVGVLPAPAGDLAFVLHPWVVSSQTLTAHGWHPAYDNVTCLGILLEAVAGRYALAARRLDRRDAALGAASAAVALVGTAALLRRTRRR